MQRNKLTKVILIFVLLLAFVLFWRFSPKQKSDAWYNTSWLYRRLVTITNTGGTTGTEDILIVVDTASLISAGKMQSTCGDLRFASHDDTTSLTYWIEAGCNTSTTQVWVRMPYITGGGDSLYMYYGNPSATTTEQAWGGKFYTMKTTACDTGWTTESASGGSFYQRFPKGGTTGGTTGGLATHNHGTLNITSTSFLGSLTVNWQYATSSNGGALTHTHTVALPIPDSPSLPPYLDMIFCSTNKLQIKSGMITLFSTTPTTGFTRFTALDNKIPRGNTTYGGTATTTTHSHTIPATTSGAPSSFTSCENKNNNTVASQSHTHTFPSSTTSTSSHVPPYLTSIFGQAGSDTYANTSMIMMASSVPPYGWNTVSTYSTRYPYGATTYGTTDGSAEYTCTTNLQYFADPTDDGSKYPTETWSANVKATDNNSLSSSTQTSSGIELNSIVGFTTGITVDYGVLIPGQKHDPLNRTTVVTGQGNVGLNIEISATAMCTDYPTCTAGTPIAPENQRYASAASTAYSLGTAITTTPTLTNIYVQKPTTTTPTSSTLWLGNNVPAGINSGAYQGKMTITCGRSNPTNW